MAAKPKLSHEEWAKIRYRWEGDQRKGFPWIIEEMGLPVSAEALRLRSKSEGWSKVGSKAATPKYARTIGEAKNSGKSKLGKGSESKLGNSVERSKLTSIEDADPDFRAFDQLIDKQEMFVREYMVDWNAKQAAIRAGYSAKSAGVIGWELLNNPKIREAIETLASARARRLGIDADELMRLWSSIVSLDANEISQLRRICCPFCWGKDHQRQYTPSGLEGAIKSHERERARRKKADPKDDIGEFDEYLDAWYDKRKEPHEDCPECGGQGVVEVFFNDTRHLSPAAKMVYAGVKVGRDGIEVLTLSKEKAMDNLARALGLFKEKDVEVSINMVSGDELFRIYEEKMRQARDRQALVLAERGIVIESGDEQA